MSPKRTDWLLPLALGAVQLGLWPGAVLFRQPPAVLALVLAATAAVVAALGFRRVRPVTALIATHLAVASAQCGVAPLGADSDSLVDVLTVAPLIALFSVAAWTGVRTTLIAAPALTASTVVVNTLTPGYYAGESGVGLALLVAADALLAALIALLGHRRQAWRRGREQARRRLAETEAARAEAARGERHRLARELHDVSAHHLTAIVVTVTAARRLATTRPELAADALTFSAQAARRTLDTLVDLVAVMRSADAAGDLPARLAGLGAEFQRLGQPVTLDLAAPTAVPADVADAAFAIVREALTNTIRYAPGGAVTIRLADDDGAVGVTVTNGPAARASDADGVGSGSGLAGARSRAEQLGGTLTAGPDGAGWRVAARLPVAAAGASPPSRLARAWQERAASVRGYLTDALIAVILALGGVAVLLVDPALTTGGSRPAGFAVAALIVAHTVPLVWAHRAPWWVLGGVLAVLAGWAIVAATGVLPAGSLSVLTVAGFAEVYAVYAVAAHGRGRAAFTWPAAPATAGVLGLAIAVGVGADLARSGDAPEAGPAELVALTVVLGGFVTVLLAVPMLAAWIVGASWRRRLTRLRSRERDVVAAAAASAAGEALAERWRIAAELRSTVLDRATAVLTAASPPVPAVPGVRNAALPPTSGVPGGGSPASPTASDVPGHAVPPSGSGTPGGGTAAPGAGAAVSQPVSGEPGASPVASGVPGAGIGAAVDGDVPDGGAGGGTATGPADGTAARLDAVLEAARATLAAMRELLGSLRGGAGAGEAETAPQPTAAQIGALCEAQRAAGRPVLLRYATPLPELPPGVDVSAYRLIEAALALPGAGPLEIVIGVTGGLRIFLNRIPVLTDARVAAGLRGRVDAVSGAMTVHPGGETEIWLPLAAASEEVRSSPYA
ncbi:histidine kinase [Catenuloplanes atrovinosus]|uniref:histidine kinase n=1 Tax=Catenuloplanes atrovinosus TaxID=137266 RepID=A0AAE3YPI1_9ACTN|nr:histidine kinase [Catenuloplanes atrovinosus]MDR7275934.1 signal transduction histidine kinase [Catenuloplanes atrovinosus]